MNSLFSKLRLTGKIAIITGGARGIGKNFAKTLAQAGTQSVGLLDWDATGCHNTCDELQQQFPDTLFIPYQVDVSQKESIEKVIDDFANSQGKRLDIACNNAAIIYSGIDASFAAENTSLEQWQKTIQVNLTGVFLCCQAEAKWMIPRRYGKIINIASMSGHIVNHPQKHVAYHTAKAGVVHLTKTLGAEWAEKGIHVNCISPGYMDTWQTAFEQVKPLREYWIQLTPAKRLGQVEDLEGPFLLLASDASSFMYGSEIIVDGGYCLW
ncbi:short-chain dehydrogenase/reductase SDR isoform 1 [Galdieria sulphuraria]|uniref:D-arabinitol 2-dehydrogenase [ribulose-forming] n=1 Tax=Galdieria sulphuraria TaxID=130081 RepID=M2Y2B3_GALSU|nr:short-chain dehydrogenase/reductase SDR isoform 1 [Galdieria sulphuraria]EME30103.1 short-chain dehydrogenase/reductase SDR isoform 1 [Galdieria sulphuraria]|eukprot:XP_005706623.1 short-chain dehydrogenase/reductase SDR isoform 1 [Galdieria sulphuraria]